VQYVLCTRAARRGEERFHGDIPPDPVDLRYAIQHPKVNAEKL
jgi:hypothetical protein